MKTFGIITIILGLLLLSFTSSERPSPLAPGHSCPDTLLTSTTFDTLKNEWAGQEYSAILVGIHESGQNHTVTRGKAFFHFSKDFKRLYYSISTKGVSGIKFAHIHLTHPEEIAVCLSCSVHSNPILTRHKSLFAEGMLDNNCSGDTLVGKVSAVLKKKMMAGLASVDIHTGDSTIGRISGEILPID